ncbi:XRE family transcriptional regulator [Candidatus Peribacteria bacterium]|nr:XRE family transcriptional regulator [Candidatus Peribacteria bacterium]
MTRKFSSDVALQEHDKIMQSIRYAVGQSGMTQEEIGLQMGFSEATARANVSRILSEDNNPTLKTLVRLASVLRISIRTLLTP